MKRNIISLLVLMVSFTGLWAQSPIINVNGFYFRLMSDVDSTNAKVAVVTNLGNTDYYKGEITIPSSVSSQGVEYPVTAIGELAFKGCKELTSITIPSSVTTVPAGAFYGCDKLASIVVAAGNPVYDSRDNCNAVVETATNTIIAGCSKTAIPTSVASLGECAFYGSRGLTTLTVSDNIKQIGQWTFLDCDNIESLNWNSVCSPASVTYYASESIKEIVLGDSVKSVYGLARCGNLKSIVIPDGVTRIEQSAFAMCTGLESIVIPSSVTRIDAEAFRGCTGLKSITIPSSVQFIASNAFRDCNNVETLYWNSNLSLGDYNILRNFKTSLKTIVIGDSVKTLDLYAFDGCVNLTTITVEQGNPVFDSRNGCNAIIETATNTFLLGCRSSVIPEGVTAISNAVFSECGCPAAITLPSSLLSIADNAFMGCGELESLHIPAKVRSIGKCLTSGCNNLISITVDPDNQFYDSRNSCNAIIETQTDKLIVGCKTTIIPSDVRSIEDYAFYGCNALESINLPDNIKNIGEWAFAYCDSLKSLSIPNGITEIGAGLVYGCISLVSIDIPSSVKKIGNDAFSYCFSLESVIIPEGVTDISFLFRRCYSLSYLSLPSTATFENDRYPFGDCTALKTAGPKGGGYDLEFSWKDTIPGCAFNGMRGLKSLYIPKTIKVINCEGLDFANYEVRDGDSRYYCYKTCYFEGCDSLESLAISFSDTKIMKRISAANRYTYESPVDNSLFLGTRIRSVTILDDSIESLLPIRNGIYYVVISKYVKKIHTGVFSQLNDLFNIEVEKDNSYYSSLDGVLFNKDRSELLAYPIIRNDNYLVPRSVSSISALAFKNSDGLKAVRIPSDVKRIGESAFEDCRSLREVTIDGSPEIGLDAFKNCINIEGVWTRSSVHGMMNVYDTPQTIVSGDYSSFTETYDTELKLVYNDDLGRLVTEISARGVMSWTSTIALPEIPEGRYNIYMGILPSSRGLPNYIHPVIYGLTESGSEVLYDSIAINEVVDSRGRIRKIPTTYYYVNDTTDYDSVMICNLFIPSDYKQIIIRLECGVNERNCDRYESTLLLDRIFVEPVEVNAPLEAIAGTFASNVFSDATLYVPDGAVESYKAADGWKLFKNIAVNNRTYPADEVEVTISDAGYATFYYSDGDYALPEGLYAMVVCGIFNDKLVYEIIARGSEDGVVPAGVPVVLVSNDKKAGVYKLPLANRINDYVGFNLLVGSDTDIQTYAENSSRFYKLAYGPAGTDLSDVLGWYWGAADGGAFNIEAHKAWLALPKATTKGMAGFSLTGDLTYVIGIDEGRDDEMIIYDMYGRRVSAPSGSGLYIINGKKIMITE